MDLKKKSKPKARLITGGLYCGYLKDYGVSFFQALPVLCKKKFCTRESYFFLKIGFASIPRFLAKTLRLVESLSAEQ